MPGFPPPQKKKLESLPVLPLLGGALLVALVAAGWWWKSRPKPEPPVHLPIVETLGIYSLQVTPTPYPMLTGGRATLTLRLEKAGEPMVAAGLAGSTTHPVTHKEIGIPCKEFSDGNYSCELAADHPGDWVVRFTFYDGGIQRYIATTLKARG